MRSAEGKVQDQKYTSTFPLLLNVVDRPTYFVALKDNAGLVKMYAFVDMKRYQLVGLGATVEEAQNDYINVLKKENEDIPVDEDSTLTGTISEIYNAVVEGNTRYYFKLEGKETIFIADIQISSKLPFYKVGDTVTVTFTETETYADVTDIQ